MLSAASVHPARAALAARALTALALAAGAACAKERLPSAVALLPVRKVEITPTAQTIGVDSVATFHATVTDSSGAVVQGISVVWASADSSIAAPGGNGRMLGRSPGTTTITASAGGKSGAASLTVVPPSRPRSVASVQVQPASAEVPIQGSWPFRATALDSVGNAIPGVTFAWSSADAAVATVAGGLATGVAPGAAVITATAPNGKAGSGTITVLQPGTGPWPNEPAGYTGISDQPWDLLTSLNWILEFGVASIGLDLSAPLSPPNVLTEVYPAGMGGGTAPGTETYVLGNGVTELYMGQWWKVSNPWQGHDSNVNKIEFVFLGDGSDAFLAMYGSPGGPYELRAIPQFHNLPSNWLVPNVNHVPVSLGSWHKVEWLVIEDTTTSPPTGIFRWWLDGLLIGDYSGVIFPSSTIQAFKLSPTWGGVGDTKNETDYFWFDHTHLSGR